MFIFRVIFVFCASIGTCFNVQKALYLSHTASAASPLFTLCLKAQSALIGSLAGSVVIGQPLRDFRPLTYDVQCVGEIVNRSVSITQ